MQCCDMQTRRSRHGMTCRKGEHDGNILLTAESGWEVARKLRKDVKQRKWQSRFHKTKLATDNTTRWDLICVSAGQ